MTESVQFSVDGSVLKISVTDSDVSESIQFSGDTEWHDIYDSELEKWVSEQVCAGTSELTFPEEARILARDRDTKQLIDVFEKGDTGTLDPGEYIFEACGIPIKAYCSHTIRASVRIDGTRESSSDGVTLEFSERVALTIGARTTVEQSSGTIKTPPDEESLISAVSHLCGAPRHEGPERSLPMFRAPPADLEIADEFSVEGDISEPEGDITIYVPKAFETVFSTAPLAFYLGAKLRPYDQSIPIVILDGHSVALGAEHPAADSVIRGSTPGEAAAKMLEQAFLLDSLTREAGWGDVNKPPMVLDEVHEAVEADGQSFDIDELYELPPADRYRTYIDYPLIAEQEIFDWPIAADITPETMSIPSIPEVMSNLADVSSPPKSRFVVDDAMSDLVESFFNQDVSEDRAVQYRSTTATPTPSGHNGTDSPSATSESSRMEQGTPDPSSVTSEWSPSQEIDGEPVSPAPGPHQQHIAVVPDYPIWSSKPLETVPINRPTEDVQLCGHAEVEWVAVQNDIETVRPLASFYSDPSVSEATTEYKSDISVEELRSIIEDGCDFFHFDGHVSDDGLQCSDGKLDIENTDTSNVDIFLLNGCSSFRQGEQFLKNGANAGVVSAGDVLGRSAARFATNCVGLLAKGFSIGASLSIIQTELNTPPRYLVLGDWRHIIHPVDPQPSVAVVDGPGAAEGEVQFRLVGHSSGQWGLGSLYHSQLLETVDDNHHGAWFGPGEIGPFSAPWEEVYKNRGDEACYIANSWLYTDDGSTTSSKLYGSDEAELPLRDQLQRIAKSE